MASFQFVIPLGAIANNDPSSNTTVVADRGMSRTVTQRVITAKFGDGYEQRAQDGLNIKGDLFNVSFNNRLASEINLIAKFLDVKAGNNFDFIVTEHGSDATLKVVCDTYSVNYVNESFHSLTATFRRVYEP